MFVVPWWSFKSVLLVQCQNRNIVLDRVFRSN